ncbi:unnamed protein product [Rangifer tarandus platyrhynchus]|uniref:Uncharacterized protein n=2 Tax=Rangifer tarandus platyrhynchus TaxID=3082113 RepID=A0ACB0ELV9_RANTA|nr:unnamed protein product [Rangifer tarandus platyrhynchus]CAI9701650.1 unnamed protein product [Rangifer tarandus platyrhynchus]
MALRAAGLLTRLDNPERRTGNDHISGTWGGSLLYVDFEALDTSSYQMLISKSAATYCVRLSCIVPRWRCVQIELLEGKVLVLKTLNYDLA